MTNLSTMVLKKTGKVAIDVLLSQWEWISMKDVNENSRIFIGNKVNRMYILLARAAVLGFLVMLHSPIVTKIEHIQKHIKDIIQAQITFYQSKKIKKKLGSAILKQFMRFLDNSWNVFIDMVLTTIDMTVDFVKIIGSLAGLTGEDGQGITHLLAISFENILVNKSILAKGGYAATLGTLGFITGVSIFSFLERKVVGILAASSEYMVHRQTPILTDDNRDRLLIVAGENPYMDLVPFTLKYEFTNDAGDIDDQFRKEIEFRSWKSFLRGSSRLGDAIRAAKIYLELTGSRELITNNNSNPRKKERPSVNGGVRRRGGRGKSRSRMKTCEGTTRDNEPCRNKTSNRYCRIHRNRGLEPKKDAFADKTLIVF
jgi:hypothetical protein